MFSRPLLQNVHQGQKAYKTKVLFIQCVPTKKNYLKSDHSKQFSRNYHVAVPFFPGFNMHYVNSIFQFNLRIFTKRVRGLLSSILNALHHGVIPWALAQFFATTHHVECSSTHFSACALPLFKAVA
jgi:hypothetical protein